MPRIKKFGKRKHTGNAHSGFTSNGRPNLNKLSEARPSPNTSIESRPNSPNSNCSSSKKKLKYLSMVGKKCDYVKDEMMQGNIIVDLEILNSNISSFASCRNCAAENSLRLSENTTNRKGIVSNLVLSCSECSAEKSFMTSNRTDSKHYDNNLRLVYGCRSIGKGQKAAETFCSIMNTPPPPTRFYDYNKRLLQAVEQVSSESMAIARREAITENDGDSDITVGIDGTWQKRGHTSIHGVITATSLDTGKVLDVECLSKYCPTCKVAHKKDHPNCHINYQGSSGGMEVVGVNNLFHRSSKLDVPVRYVHFLGDGDSKSFDAVAQSKPYGDDVTIDKLECINHVQKRMGTRLRLLRKELKNKLLPDGKKLSGRGRLTSSVIDSIQDYYGKAIRASSTLDEMKQACWAIFYHKASTDADPQHGLCPLGLESWCKYNRAAAQGLPCPEHTNSLPLDIMEAIKPVFVSLCDPNLLKRCLKKKLKTATNLLTM